MGRMDCGDFTHRHLNAINSPRHLPETLQGQHITLLLSHYSFRAVITLKTHLTLSLNTKPNLAYNYYLCFVIINL